MKIQLTFSLLFFSLLCLAQSNSRMSVDFIHYENPLTGGFEAPQIQPIDLNGDDEKDLLVFDRKGSAIRTFIYDASAEFNYQYAPEYESIFPSIPCWVMVRDYNQDGVDDLFTCGVTDQVTGIEVWTGVRNNGQLSFVPYDHPEGPYNIIYYERNSEFKQLYVGNNGIPGIADVDDDGDIDILAFQPAGGYLYYFQNMSQERGYGSDSLVFERSDECWGNFYEGGLIPDIILSESDTDCAIPRGLAGVSKRHEGITLSVFDKNEDGLQDLLIGEVSSNNLIYVQNGGTPEDAFAVFKETNFPSNDVPVDIQIFLASFVFDVDHDGVDDLLVAPNSQFGTNTDQVSFYQGIDTSFQYVQDDWLVNSTIDVGTDAHPTFIDYNADGLLDLLVGSFGLIGLETGTETRLFLFENVGTDIKPIYELVDDNYLNFKAFSEFDKSFVPSVGDLDGDGDEDLVLGSLSGELIFVENISGEGNPMQFANPIFDYQMLDSENNTIKVDISDVNGDGLPDIIVGGRNSYSLPETIGSLKAFINDGSEGSPSFTNQKIIKGLGGVNVKDAGTSKVSAAPKFYSDGDRKLLFIGNETGRIAVYESVGDGDYLLIDDDLLEEYLGRRVGLDVADIDNDGYLEVVIGNERGGLNFYNTVIQSSGDISSTEDIFSEEKIQIFPNPVRSILNFEKPIENAIIYDSVGRMVLSIDGTTTEIDVSLLSDGVYFMYSSVGSSKFIKKVE